MKKCRTKTGISIQGFSLIELLLVMVIITVFILSSTLYLTQKTENMRIDKTVAQMQYILNAGLAFYVANGRWPDSQGYTFLNSGTASQLQPDYLPATPIPTQFGGFDPYYYTGYFLFPTGFAPANAFQVVFFIGMDSPEKRARGKLIAARLPHGYYDDTWAGYVYASVDAPGQNLNNATAINFVGLYHHGACVPVPSCPEETASSDNDVNMSPEIFVVPVSVSGVNDPGTSGGNVYPISSFTAFSTQMSDYAATPPACPGGVADVCTPINGNAPGSMRYWRVCLQVITARGNVQDTRSDEWGDRVTLAAFTRCNISTEPAGSDFSVFTH